MFHSYPVWGSEQWWTLHEQSDLNNSTSVSERSCLWSSFFPTRTAKSLLLCIPSVNKMSLARLSTMYMALKRDRNDSSSSSERLPLSDSSEDYHDESFDKDHFDDGPRYGDYPHRPHFQWSSLCFHLILASIYGAAFLTASYRSTSSIKNHDSKPKHLIACKYIPSRLILLVISLTEAP